MKISHQNVVHVDLELEPNDLVLLTSQDLAYELTMSNLPQEYKGDSVKFQFVVHLKERQGGL